MQSPTATSTYDYDLPSERIAVNPPAVRGSSRLLVLDRKTGAVKDQMYTDLPDLLESGDLVIINTTKVIPARLFGKTEDGKKIELLLLERHGEAFGGITGSIMYRGKLRQGQRLSCGAAELTITRVLDGGLAEISSTQPLLQLTESDGAVPLPPYMKRDATDVDRERYQTVFAEQAGSVAAPTASLNLTDEIMDRMKARGIEIAPLTLHVGLGTFMPIRGDDLKNHQMHQEYYEIPPDTVDKIRSAKAEGRRVIAIGTTVTRTLEYAEPDIINADPGTALSGEADIFMYPGYKFKLIDGVVTNFHAPRSTVLMLTAAWAGWPNLRIAYDYAIAEKYAFLSYGDSMLMV